MKRIFFGLLAIGLSGTAGYSVQPKLAREDLPHFDSDLAGCKADRVRLREAAQKFVDGKLDGSEKLYNFYDAFNTYDKDRATRTCLAYNEGRIEVSEFYQDKLIFEVCERAKNACVKLDGIWVRPIHQEQAP